MMGSDTILLAAANSVLRAMAEHPGGKVGELERRLWSLEATSELSWWWRNGWWIWKEINSEPS